MGHIELEDAPEMLYKYRQFDDDGYHLKLLSRGELYFPSARNLNDPFDSSLPYQFDSTEEEIREWASGVVRRDPPDGIKFLRQMGVHPEKLKWLRNEILETRLPVILNDEYIKDFQEHIINTNYKKFGICSLSTKRKQLLMWAHYSANHSGFCVGISKESIERLKEALFDNGQEILSIAEVDYAENLPKVNFFEAMSADPSGEHIIDMITTKSSDWEYEDEYRLLYFDNSEQTVSLGRNGIDEVILGCKISDENKRKALEAIEQLGGNPDVYQARRHNNKFDLVLDRI